jgi:hypothetical protein
MSGQFFVGTVADGGPFTQRFAPNAVLAGLADTTLQDVRFFSANDALFSCLGHLDFFSGRDLVDSLS